MAEEKCAISLATISQAPESIRSSLLGNFAIHNSPFTSCTLALGLAPPKDEPGAISRLIHFSKSGLSCSIYYIYLLSYIEDLNIIPNPDPKYFFALYPATNQNIQKKKPLYLL